MISCGRALTLHAVGCTSWLVQFPLISVDHSLHSFGYSISCTGSSVQYSPYCFSVGHIRYNVYGQHFLRSCSSTALCFFGRGGGRASQPGQPTSPRTSPQHFLQTQTLQPLIFKFQTVPAEPSIPKLSIPILGCVKKVTPLPSPLFPLPLPNVKEVFWLPRPLRTSPKAKTWFVWPKERRPTRLH